MPVAAAIVGSAAIGAVASTSAANKAVKASDRAAERSIAQQEQATALAQSNTAVARERGDQALNRIAQNLGLGGGAAVSGLPTGQQPNWSAVLADRPDVAAAVNDPSYGYKGETVEERLADWWSRDGQKSGYQLPTVAAPATNNYGVNLSPAAQVQTYTRPNDITAPAPFTPTNYSAPEYVRPEYDGALDVSYDAYLASPEALAADYDISQQTGAASSALAASGAGKSGAAMKRLQQIGQDGKVKYYSDFRNYRANQFNADRNRFDQNYNYDTGLKASLAQSYDQLNNSNQLFGANLARQDYQYAQGRADQNFNLDRAYGTDLSMANRAWETGRHDQYNANLLNVANIGQGAAAQSTNAAQNGAASQSNALFSSAANQGNAALTGAAQFNSLLNSGVNALAYYYGNKGSTAKPTAAFKDNWNILANGS